MMQYDRDHDMNKERGEEGSMNIGFIGVGQMGGRMALRLLNAGCDLTVHDILKETARSLLDKGAKWVNT